MNTRFPIAIYWGPEHVVLYNDAWIPILGGKHPAAFSCTANPVWAEIWDVIGPRFARVMNGEAIFGENEHFAVLRHGCLEECYCDYTISPVRCEGGRVVGIFGPAIETTYRVVAARRSCILRELTETIATAESVEQVCATANQVLAAASADVPFCLIYLVDDDRHARRIDVAGFAHNDAACPHVVDLTQHSQCPWPLALAFQTQQLQVVDDLKNTITSLVPGSAWPEAARAAALAEANRELESFAYTVSHDLRSPLRSINGFAQVLAEDERERLSPEGMCIVGRLKEAGSKLDHLIQDVLEYGRVGQLPMTRRPVDMSQLAREVADELRPQYRNNHVTIDSFPGVKGDATMLRQILQNLIGNALKFSSQQATPTVHVGAQQSIGETVYFVRDNGVGFEMRQAAALFHMFRRLHSERDFLGTGVGLAIVKRLIERHDGRIWVESSPGQGATFFFTLGHKTQTSALQDIRCFV